MKFLLDANIPYSAQEVFGGDHEAVHVRDIGLATAEDEKIIAWAKRRRAALVTRDFDFGNIINFPPREYWGIVVLKLPPSYGAREIKRMLENFLASFDCREIPHSVIIVEEGRVRVRR